ncbi:hypothetical protein L596_023528 [Steinernema carpocapsae]|uniref:Uncharacterized protein n=1 Tax=Steinernema carpocapsae TaxID=34508 RepID=A0A4U5MDY1_STECR|nr:hypothetical protein L596_023528 [Steinernema carpocapsae]
MSDVEGEAVYSDESSDSTSTVYTDMRPGLQYSVHFEVHKAYDDLPYNSAASFEEKNKDAGNRILEELAPRRKSQSVSEKSENEEEEPEKAKEEESKENEEEKPRRSRAMQATFNDLLRPVPKVETDPISRHKLTKVVNSRRWRESGYHPGYVMEPRSVEKMSPVWNVPQYANIMHRHFLEVQMFQLLYFRRRAKANVRRSRSHGRSSKKPSLEFRHVLSTQSVLNIAYNLKGEEDDEEFL